MPAAESLAIISAGCFFLTGLLTGVWKYQQIHNSPEAQAHYYVDIAHRTALLYSFACLLLYQFVVISQLPARVEFYAVLAQIAFFAAAVFAYIVHGWLGDTDNQLRKPYTLGSRTLPAILMVAFMWSLIVAEIGGFLVLFYGVITAALA